MKVTVVEGTPTEIREAFPNLIPASENGSIAALVPADTTALATGSGYTAEFETWLDQHRHTTYAPFVRQLIDVLVAEGLRPEIGVASKAADGKADYVRIHIASAKSLPAIAYVFPRAARVNIRLPEDVVTDANKDVVAVRGVKPEDLHKVVAAITDAASVDLVVDLIRDAKQRVEDGSYTA